METGGRSVPERRIVVIGIAGRSGSGKSTIAQRLATRLNSPVLSIQQDWFFRHALEGFAESYEEPEAIDWDAFSAALEAVIRTLRAGTCPAATAEATRSCSSDSHCPLCSLQYPPKPKRRGMDLVRRRSPSTVGLKSSSAIVYVVVEGFLLFHNLAVMHFFDVRVTLEADAEQCCLRRFLRDNCVDVVASDPQLSTEAERRDREHSMEYALSTQWGKVKVSERDPVKMAASRAYQEDYRSWYFDEVEPAYQRYWPTQRQHAATPCGSTEPSVKALRVGSTSGGDGAVPREALASSRGPMVWLEGVNDGTPDAVPRLVSALIDVIHAYMNGP